MNTASAEDLHRSTYEPLETRKNRNELLLQEDALIFLLHNEHIFTPPNFTLIAHPSATSEGSLYRSDGGFPQTDVPSSQYTITLCAHDGLFSLLFLRLPRCATRGFVRGRASRSSKNRARKASTLAWSRAARKRPERSSGEATAGVQITP